jgi:hypothetical protein
MASDDLQALWRRYDAQLASMAHFNAALVRRSSLGATQTALGRLANALRFELVLDAFALFLIGAFEAAHAREPVVLAAAVTLHAYALAIAIAVVVQLVALARIDYDEPVFAIARAVDRLRLSRARAAMWTLLFAPLMWPPLAIVALRGLFGPGALATCGPLWLLANAAFGLAVLAGALVVARRYGKNLPPASRARRAFDSLSGSAVRSAAASLDTLVRYETEI